MIHPLRLLRSIRFSLGSLLRLVLLAAAVGLLWRKWEKPWVLEREVPGQFPGQGVAFSPDDRLLFLVGRRNWPEDLELNLDIMDVRSGEIRLSLPWKDTLVANVTNDSRHMLRVLRDGTVEIWSTETFTCERQVRAGLKEVDDAAVAGNGAFVVLHADNGRLFLKELAGEQSERPLDENSVGSIHISSNSVLLMYETQQNVVVWDVAERRERLKRPRADGWHWTFSQDCRTLVATVATHWQEGATREYDLATGELKCVRPILLRDHVDANRFFPDGRVVDFLWPKCDADSLIEIISDDGSLDYCIYEGAERASAAAARKSNDLLALTWHKGGSVQLWHRRRPEYWWGIAWLPEFWLTIVLAGGFVVSVWRDRRRLAA